MFAKSKDMKPFVPVKIYLDLCLIFFLFLFNLLILFFFHLSRIARVEVGLVKVIFKAWLWRKAKRGKRQNF